MSVSKQTDWMYKLSGVGLEYMGIFYDNRYIFECSRGHQVAIASKQKSQITDCPLCKMQKNCIFNLIIDTDGPENIYINNNSWIRGMCGDCGDELFVTPTLINNNQKDNSVFNKCASGHKLPNGKFMTVETMRIFEDSVGLPCYRTYLFGSYHPTAYNPYVNFALLHIADTKNKTSDSPTYIKNCRKVCETLHIKLILIESDATCSDIRKIVDDARDTMLSGECGSEVNSE